MRPELTVVQAAGGYPQHAWQQLILDAERFLERWGAQAASLGWQDWELLGCHRRAPWGRIQGMGLVLLLRGDELAALTDSEAVIRTQTGARPTHRRKPFDPLHPTERCLITDAYVCRLLPLTCLASDIVEAILDGRQPRGLRLAEMLGNGPLAWEEQRMNWGTRFVDGEVGGRIEDR